MTLLAALALCFQAKAAEDTFKKIEEQVEKAKTLSFRFKQETVIKMDQEGTIVTEGTVFLKEGDKLCLEFLTKDPESFRTYSGVSDGTRLQERHGARDLETREVPRNLFVNFKAALLRAGTYEAIATTHPGGGSRLKDGEDAKKVFLLTDLTSGADPKILSYTLRVNDERSQGTLRYDPKTWAPVERTMKLRGRPPFTDVEGNLRETYREFTLDADITDEKFKLSPEKK